MFLVQILTHNMTRYADNGIVVAEDNAYFKAPLIYAFSRNTGDAKSWVKPDSYCK